jgi:hypothetical protein
LAAPTRPPEHVPSYGPAKGQGILICLGLSPAFQHSKEVGFAPISALIADPKDKIYLNQN